MLPESSTKMKFILSVEYFQGIIFLLQIRFSVSPSSAHVFQDVEQLG